MGRAIAFCAFCAAVLAACTADVTLTNPVHAPPLVDESPARLGVYYDPALRAHSCVVEKGYIAADWGVTLGPPSMAMFDGVFATMFAGVIPLKVDPRRWPPRGTDGYVVISLAEFDGCEAAWPIIGERVKIAYGAAFFSADGRPVARFTARGAAGPNDSRPEPTLDIEAVYLTQIVEAAMRRAAADLIVQMDGDERMRDGLNGR